MYRFTLTAHSCDFDDVLGSCVVDVEDFIELDRASSRFGASFCQGDTYVVADGETISEDELFELYDAGFQA